MEKIPVTSCERSLVDPWRLVLRLACGHAYTVLAPIMWKVRLLRVGCPKCEAGLSWWR